MGAQVAKQLSFKPTSMNGQLSEQPLAELIREIMATGLSGALRLTRERVQAAIYAQAGAIIHARSNLRAHRLMECLRRWEFMTPEQLGAFGDATTTEDEVCAALVSTGVIKPEEWPALRLRQSADVLRPMLLWTDGAWSFEPRARLAEEAAGAVATAELLLEGARRLPAEFAAARLMPEDVLAPVPVAPDGLPPAQLSLLPTEAFVLSRVDAPLTLAELVAISGLPETETRHTAYALALAGLLARKHWPAIFDARTQAQGRANAPAPAPAAGAPVAPPASAVTAEQPAAATETDPQAEVAALLARARSADYYEVLGVARSAAPGEIKRTYYALAKRFHPDRFRRVVDESERSRVEAAFARIAQAYETLTDERTRSTYDAKLPPPSIARPATHQSAPASPAPSAASDHASAPTAAATPRAPVQDSKENAEESFQQGLAALKQDNYPAATICLATAVRLAPKQARYHAYYGRALAHDPRARHRAEVELQAAIVLDAANANYHVMLAELYQTLGQLRRAETALKRALALDPKHREARRLLDRQKSGDK
ncbi:MAG TPA: DUF4388 domain-containing protein [Pyrinomonadaceae bacterium]